MATIKIDGYDEVFKEIENLGGKELDRIAKRALYEGAAILHEALSASLAATVSPDSTGDLEKSLGIAPHAINKNGNWGTKVGFSGYDRKGTPNQLKARALESGTSKQRKTQFATRAIRQNKQRAETRMRNVINLEYFQLSEKINNRK